MRLIDADALIRRWCGIKCGCERDECGREIEPCIVVMAIEEAMTIDAVPVVMCKDCRYADDYYNDGSCYCKHPEHEMRHIGTNWNWYCADGERKDNDRA